LAGNSELFHDLIRPHEQSAYRMALSMVKNESDASDAEDIAQEADPAGLATCLDDAGAYKQVLAAKLGVAHAFGVSLKIGFPGVHFSGSTFRSGTSSLRLAEITEFNRYTSLVEWATKSVEAGRLLDLPREFDRRRIHPGVEIPSGSRG
jgi:hypothetical protein